MRQRDPLVLATQIYDELLAENGLKRSDVDYCATTGEGRERCTSTPAISTR